MQSLPYEIYSKIYSMVPGLEKKRLNQVFEGACYRLRSRDVYHSPCATCERLEFLEPALCGMTLEQTRKVYNLNREEALMHTDIRIRRIEASGNMPKIPFYYNLLLSQQSINKSHIYEDFDFQRIYRKLKRRPNEYSCMKTLLIAGLSRRWALRHLKFKVVGNIWAGKGIIYLFKKKHVLEVIKQEMSF